MRRRLCAMTTSDKSFRDLENDFWRAIQDNDAQTITRLTAERSVVVGAQGHMEIARDELAGMISGGGWVLKSFEIDEGSVVVNHVSDDVALVAYKVSEGMEVEGKPVEMTAY